MVQKLARVAVWSLSATLGVGTAATAIDAALAPLAAAQASTTTTQPSGTATLSTASTTTTTSTTVAPATTGTSTTTTTVPPPPHKRVTPTVPTTAKKVPLTTATTVAPPSTTSTSTTVAPTTTTVPTTAAPVTAAPSLGAVTGGAALPLSSELPSPTASLWLAKADGTVSEFGSSSAMPPASVKLGGKVVAVASTPDGGGYWLVDAKGQVVAAGDAVSHGDALSLGLHLTDVVGIASSADGAGYWLVDAHGGVLAFGDAVAYGSVAGQRLSGPVVGITPTPDGKGYWEFASDGGVFAFGDAPFLGSGVGPVPIDDVVSLTPSLDGKGYWLLQADGAVYTYGDSDFEGALTDQFPATKFVGFTLSLDGKGYWMTAADGTVVALGDAQPATTAATSVTAAPAASTTTGTKAAGTAPTVFTSTVVSSLPSPSAAPSQTAASPAAVVPVVAVAPANRLVPASYVTWDVQAAATCPGLPWTVLAAIGSVETDFGRSTLPGVHSGSNSAGAQGPMQFLPGTFAAYDHPVAADEAPTPADGAVPPSTYDTVDAIWAAARLLCSSGGSTASGLSGAIYSYNHSPSYVATVEALAATYQGSGEATPVALAAVHASLSQLGVPYVWGGETPGAAFDCSGLVQWAYRTAGITIPRTTQVQWADLPHLPATAVLEPGDLIYYGPDNGPTHVGMYLGDGRMIDAPYTGVDVRIDPVDTGENIVGAIRPSLLGQTTTATGLAMTSTGQ